MKQKSIEWYINRVKELEKAIVDAESWMQPGEGVGLTHYHDDYGDDDSVKVIDELVGR